MENVIVNSTDEIISQLAKFNSFYPEILLVKETDHEVRLSGKFNMHKIYSGFQVNQTYAIEIVVPIFSTHLPYVIDSDKYIDPQYPHYYQESGKLCLEADAKILVDYVDGFDLVHWMNKYVESYFYVYEYYKRFNEYPYGERSHGLDGVFEAYQDIFHAQNVFETYQIMQYINNKKYRGHSLCPCNSGKKIRNCHGTYMLVFYKHKFMYNKLKKDYTAIKEALEHEKNKSKTK